MKIEMIPATAEHVRAIAANIRPEDAAELWATVMQTPEQAMMMGLRESDKAMTGLVDDVPICMWGVVNESLIGPCGAPWMVGTTLLDKHAILFLRRCAGVVASMFDGYQHLENYIDARNKRAIRWLKALGFKVEEKTEPYGMFGLPFHQFTMRREINV